MRSAIKRTKNHGLLLAIGLLLSLCLNSVSAQELSQNDDPEFQRVAPFQVFDNLYYVGAKWVSAWLLETDQGLILFDTLYGELTDLVIDGIRELGFDRGRAGRVGGMSRLVSVETVVGKNAARAREVHRFESGEEGLDQVNTGFRFGGRASSRFIKGVHRGSL